MEEVSVVFVNGRAAFGAFGPSDEYLRQIRKALGVRVVVDSENGKLLVRSDNREAAKRAANLLERLLVDVDRGGATLAPDDVRRAIDEVARGERVSRSQPFEVYGGKTIRAKTAARRTRTP